MGKRNRNKTRNNSRKENIWKDYEYIEKRNERFFDQPQSAPIKKPVKITPRGENQKSFISNLENPNNHIIFALGPAGTGKTMLATLHAIKLLQEEKISKIVITRPAVSVEEQWGHLPGTLQKKAEPWMMPILDVFAEYYTQKEIQKMFNENIICIEPLAFMRGRTFKNSVVIADEMQNSTPNQMKMLLTRIGENTKMVITGDLRQHDRTYDENGLLDFITKLQRHGKKCSIVINEFDNKDIQRHPVIQTVLELYGDHGDL